MAAKLIGEAGKPSDYVDYTIMSFPSWRALDSFAKKIDEKYPNTQVAEANRKYSVGIDELLRNGETTLNRLSIVNLGLFGKQPTSYEDGMKRDKFVYYEEYKPIKEKVIRIIYDELAKTSEAEAMQPNLVYNDRELGEFVYDRAAMALTPDLYYYSPSQKREIDANIEKIIIDEDEYILESDGSKIIFAFKIEKENGEIEYVKADGDESLQSASDMGIVNVSSNNKKVYLYKEKKPKVKNAVKIVVGLTAGGFTSWDNDFYTGVAAACAVEILEGLGYAVDVEVAVGGGRCSGCDRYGYPLNFPTRYGRRFFLFTAKSFDEPVDMDGLLYTICDPSFHRLKFIPLLNNFFSLYGDAINVDRDPSFTWHGIQEVDMTNPIGMYEKRLDHVAGNDNLLHFYIHMVKDENAVIAQIKDLVLTAENINLEILKKSELYDFGNTP